MERADALTVISEKRSTDLKLFPSETLLKIVFTWSGDYFRYRDAKSAVGIDWVRSRRLREMIEVLPLLLPTTASM